MSNTPIPEQPGLSDDDKKKMKVTKQKFKNISYAKLNPQSSLASQEESIKNILWRILVEDVKRKMDIDVHNEYAINDCIDKMIDDLVSGIADMVKAQAWKVTTSVITTNDFSPAWLGVSTGSGTGTAEAKDVTTE